MRMSGRGLKEWEKSSDPKELCDAQVFLEDYAVAVRMLRMCREDGRLRHALSRDTHVDAAHYGRVGGDENEWLARARAVRGFIESLAHQPCKLFLFYHYVRGLTVEQTAEELDISARSAYRRKKDALAYAAKVLAEQRRVG